MPDQVAPVEAQQQVLAAPSDFEDASSREACDLLADRPAQTRFAQDHALQALTEQVRLDAATRGFDFG